MSSNTQMYFTWHEIVFPLNVFVFKNKQPKPRESFYVVFFYMIKGC